MSLWLLPLFQAFISSFLATGLAWLFWCIHIRYKVFFWPTLEGVWALFFMMPPFILCLGVVSLLSFIHVYPFQGASLILVHVLLNVPLVIGSIMDTKPLIQTLFHQRSMLGLQGSRLLFTTFFSPMMPFLTKSFLLVFLLCLWSFSPALLLSNHETPLSFSLILYNIFLGNLEEVSTESMIWVLAGVTFFCVFLLQKSLSSAWHDFGHPRVRYPKVNSSVFRGVGVLGILLWTVFLVPLVFGFRKFLDISFPVNPFLGTLGLAGFVALITFLFCYGYGVLYTLLREHHKNKQPFYSGYTRAFGVYAMGFLFLIGLCPTFLWLAFLEDVWPETPLTLSLVACIQGIHLLPFVVGRLHMGPLRQIQASLNHSYLYTLSYRSRWRFIYLPYLHKTFLRISLWAACLSLGDLGVVVLADIPFPTLQQTFYHAMAHFHLASAHFFALLILVIGALFYGLSKMCLRDTQKC